MVMKGCQGSTFLLIVSSLVHILGILVRIKMAPRMYTSIIFWYIWCNHKSNFSFKNIYSIQIHIIAINNCSKTFGLVFGLIFIINNSTNFNLRASGNNSQDNLSKVVHITELKIGLKNINDLCIYFPPCQYNHQIASI